MATYQGSLERPGAATGDDWFAQNAPSGAPAAPDYQATARGATADDVQAAAKKLFGHELTDPTPWVGQKDFYQNLAASPEAQNYAKTQATQPAAAATTSAGPDKSNVEGWIDAKIKQYGIDPSEKPYWMNLVAQHGGSIDSIGEDWLDDRMHRADSSADVKSGKIARVNDSGSNAPTDYLQPFTEQFKYGEFTPPSAANDANDPGFSTRLKAGQEALDRSAAARGTALTGTQVQAQTDYAQDYASNEYDKIYNRAANTWQTNYGKALGEYNNRKATFYANQDNPFSKLLAQETLDSNNTNALNNLGFNYASLYSNVLGNGSNAATNYLTQGANARAAGQVGAGNAYSGLGSAIGNDALTAYYMSQYGRNRGAGA
jgi:hypothetical protein